MFMVVTMTAMILMMMLTTLMEILCCMMFMVKSHTRQILQSKSRFHHCKLSMHSVQHVLQGLHMSVQGSSHGPPKFTGTTHLKTTSTAKAITNKSYPIKHISQVATTSKYATHAVMFFFDSQCD